MTIIRSSPFSLVLGLMGPVVMCGCGGQVQLGTSNHEQARERVAANARAEAVDSRAASHAAERCDVTKARRDTSQFDTSGDDLSDVRKVYLQIGEGALARTVMICREVDVNGNGRKDVIRTYNDMGSPVQEEADRNLDGKIDQISHYQEGQIALQEFDTNHDGKIDTKIFFEAGKRLRIERDMAARSSQSHWRPDRWEYFEDGKLVRMGTDLDGDGVVDRWDRNEAFFAAQRERDELVEPDAPPADDDGFGDSEARPDEDG